MDRIQRRVDMTPAASKRPEPIFERFFDASSLFLWKCPNTCVVLFDGPAPFSEVRRSSPRFVRALGEASRFSGSSGALSGHGVSCIMTSRRIVAGYERAASGGVALEPMGISGGIHSSLNHSGKSQSGGGVAGAGSPSWAVWGRVRQRGRGGRLCFWVARGKV